MLKVLQENKISPMIEVENGETTFDSVKVAANVLKSTIAADTNLTIDNLKSIGFTLETMLISCYFDGVRCYASDFTWFHSYQYGNCFTFNSQKDDYGNLKTAITTMKSGPNTGLTLELFTGAGGMNITFFKSCLNLNLYQSPLSFVFIF